MIRPASSSAWRNIPDVGVEVSAVIGISSLIINPVDNLERAVTQDVVMDTMHMDADLLTRTEGNAVAYGEPDFVAFREDDCWPGDGGLLTVAGRNVDLINLELNHPVGKQAIFNLLRSHFDPVFCSCGFS